MMNDILLLCSILFCLASCRSESTSNNIVDSHPVVSIDGKVISFSDSAGLAFFRTETIAKGSISADLTALGRISATVQTSGEVAAQRIILFEQPELAANYAQLTQHQINISQIQNINIRQKEIELERTKDLLQHGAATGQDLLNAQMALSMEQAALANEKAAMIEHEVRLKSGGFDPEMLKRAKPGTAYMICDVAENQVGRVMKGSPCTILLTAYPDETFIGRIDDVADLVDNTTRMVKLRIAMNNSDSRLKAGMFAMVTFGLSEGNGISVSKNALITVQGRNYVFVRRKDSAFERTEVQTGPQLGDRVTVLHGLKAGDEVAVAGTMQLKGLSFGY